MSADYCLVVIGPFLRVLKQITFKNTVQEMSCHVTFVLRSSVFIREEGWCFLNTIK